VQQTPVGPAPGLVYGGFWIRFVAYLIDGIICAIAAFGLAAVVAPSASLAFEYVILSAYLVVMWGTLGQTIGMMPFGLRVVRIDDGGKINYVTAILRLIGFFISEFALLVGLIWAAFDERKRGWHDMIAGTVVVKPA
jgi:uncharacterized RDD family membrane protein YckC